MSNRLRPEGLKPEGFRFDDPLPAIIYWDTSFVDAFLMGGPSSPYLECKRFGDRLMSEGVIPVVSDFVYNEVAFIMIKRALVMEGRRLGLSWLAVKERYPDFIKGVMPEVHSTRAELDDLTLKLGIGDAVTSSAFELMERSGLLPTDAYHIAVSLDSEVASFVTLDKDFLHVDGIEVYTCLP